LPAAVPDGIPPCRQNVQLWVCPFSGNGFPWVEQAELGQPGALGDISLSTRKHPELTPVTGWRLFPRITTWFRAVLEAVPQLPADHRAPCEALPLR